MTSTIGTAAVWRATLGVAFTLVVSASAMAQTQVRVTRDQATIWRREARIPATQVRAGTVLDVVEREGDWYIVVIPPNYGGNGETGMIAAALVEPVTGGAPRGTTPQPRQAAPPRRTPVPVPSKGLEIFGTGHVGVTSWLGAPNTFEAVLGHSFGPMFGGGVDVHFHRNLFIQAAAERFQQTGQRVAVSSSGDVFRLGISDTVRVIPAWVTLGYRHAQRRGTVYGGVGGGLYFYKETSDFSDPSDNVDDRFKSYHALVGFEFGGGGVRTALEVQFTSVPNGLGEGGASAAFEERNLGGVQLRLKVLFGG